MVGDTSRALSASAALRAFCVSGMGTALEFYDFVIYGMAAARVFPQVFFPSLDRLSATLVAFCSYALRETATLSMAEIDEQAPDRLDSKMVCSSD